MAKKMMASSALKLALDLALGLSSADRTSLVCDLLASLDGPADAEPVEAREAEREPEREAEWEAEIVRRLDALQSASVQTVDADEVLRRIDAQLNR